MAIDVLSVHKRTNTGLVYAVLSRRAGGVSLGINLNTNQTCNWRCIYCQVPNLQRGTPPRIDLQALKTELVQTLDQLEAQDKTIHDVAFSGDGESTLSAQFADAVAVVGSVLTERNMSSKLRLITNGSQCRKTRVLDGIRLLKQYHGEVWFKVDRVSTQGMAQINDVSIKPTQLKAGLRAVSALCPTFVQTCLFVLDGAPPPEKELIAYLAFLEQVKADIRGVYLYGVARPSRQPEASRISPISHTWLQALAERIRTLGIWVQVDI